MGLTKKICIIMFIVLGIAFFYQNHVLSQPTLQPAADLAYLNYKTYISFREDMVGQSISKVAVVDSQQNVQIQTLYSASAPNAVSQARMARDSLGNVHTVFDYGGFLDLSNRRVFYKNINSISATVETIPFPFGPQTNPYTGFSSKYSDIAIGPNDIPYVIAFGTDYSQGAPTGTRIMISKRLSTGWTTPVTLFQFPQAIAPFGVSIEFDSAGIGHLYYVEYVNPSCVGSGCIQQLQDMVFLASTFNTRGPTLIGQAHGPSPSIFSLSALNIGTSESYIGYLRTVQSNQIPRNIFTDVVTHTNGAWSAQLLATNVYQPADDHAASIDLTGDKKKINVISTQKNTQTGIASLNNFVSINKGVTWTNTPLLTSTTSQYRDANAGLIYLGRDRQLNVGYTEGSFVAGSTIFSTMSLIRSDRTGTTNTQVYQNPNGLSLHIGDLVTVY